MLHVFWVEGDPQGEPRPRATVVGGKPRMYVPVNPWRKAVAQVAKESAPRLMEGPLAVRIACYFKRPKRLMRRRDPEGPVLHIAKPDSDNLAKAVLDALNGVLYYDDCQVAELVVRKYYCPKATDAPGAAAPGAAIEVRELEQ